MKSAFLILTLVSTFALAAEETIPKVDNDEIANSAAYVDYVEHIKGQSQDVKIFSMSGGDPAINGAHVYVAVFKDLSEGYNVYEIANVRDFKVLPSKKDGFLKLSLEKDTFEGDDLVRVFSIMYISIVNADKGTIMVDDVITKRTKVD